MPPIHVCVHSLRDNGCSPSDIEIASVRVCLSLRARGRVGGSSVGRVKHKSISLHSTASREEVTTDWNVSKAYGRWTAVDVGINVSVCTVKYFYYVSEAMKSPFIAGKIGSEGK